MELSEYSDFDLPIIEASETKYIDRNYVFEKIEQNHFACIRGLFDPKSLSKCLEMIKIKGASLNFSSASGEEREKIRENFAKVNIGGATLRYNNYPRFFRTIYNPVWEDDIFLMREHFLKLIKLRNHIYGVEENFALNDITEDGLFSATRIQNYPQGGGFFGSHRDTTLLDVADEKGINFFQLILVISQYGEDFFSGGAFVEKAGKRFMLEKECRTGDVLIYDGRSVHGVEEIDVNMPLNLNEINGRIVALASLYKT